MKTKHRRPKNIFNKTFKNIHLQVKCLEKANNDDEFFKRDNFLEKKGGENNKLKNTNNPFIFYIEDDDYTHYYFICIKKYILTENLNFQLNKISNLFDSTKTPIYEKEFDDYLSICKMLCDKIKLIFGENFIFCEIEEDQKISQSDGVKNTPKYLNYANLLFPHKKKYLPLNKITENDYFVIKHFMCKKNHNNINNDFLKNINIKFFFQILNVIFFIYGVKIDINDDYNILIKNEKNEKNEKNNIIFGKFDETNNFTTEKIKLVFFRVKYLVSEEYNLLCKKIDEDKIFNQIFFKYLDENSDDINECFNDFNKKNFFIITDDNTQTIGYNYYDNFSYLFRILNNGEEIEKIINAKQIFEEIQIFLFKIVITNRLENLKKIKKTNLALFKYSNSTEFNNFVRQIDSYANNKNDLMDIKTEYFNFANIIFGNYNFNLKKDNIKKYVIFLKFLLDKMENINNVFDDVTYVYKFDAEIVKNILLDGDNSNNAIENFPMVTNLIIKNYEILKDDNYFYINKQDKNFYNHFSVKFLYYLMRNEDYDIKNIIDIENLTDDKRTNRNEYIQSLKNFEKNSLQFYNYVKFEEIKENWNNISNVFIKLVDVTSELIKIDNSNDSFEGTIIEKKFLFCKHVFNIFNFISEVHFYQKFIQNTSYEYKDYVYNYKKNELYLTDEYINKFHQIFEEILEFKKEYLIKIVKEPFNYNFKNNNDNDLIKDVNSFIAIYINQIKTPFTFFHFYKAIEAKLLKDKIIDSVETTTNIKNNNDDGLIYSFLKTNLLSNNVLFSNDFDENIFDEIKDTLLNEVKNKIIIKNNVVKIQYLKRNPKNNVNGDMYDVHFADNNIREYDKNFTRKIINFERSEDIEYNGQIDNIEEYKDDDVIPKNNIYNNTHNDNDDILKNYDEELDLEQNVNTSPIGQPYKSGILPYGNQNIQYYKNSKNQTISNTNSKELVPLNKPELNKETDNTIKILPYSPYSQYINTDSNNGNNANTTNRQDEFTTNQQDEFISVHKYGRYGFIYPYLSKKQQSILDKIYNLNKEDNPQTLIKYHDIKTFPKNYYSMYLTSYLKNILDDEEPMNTEELTFVFNLIKNNNPTTIEYLISLISPKSSKSSNNLGLTKEKINKMMSEIIKYNNFNQSKPLNITRNAIKDLAAKPKLVNFLIRLIKKAKIGGHLPNNVQKTEQLFISYLIFEKNTNDDEDNKDKIDKIFNLTKFAKLYFEFIVFILINSNNENNENNEKIIDEFVVKLNEKLDNFYKIQKNDNFDKKNFYKKIKNFIVKRLLLNLKNPYFFENPVFNYFLLLRGGLDDITNDDFLTYNADKTTQIFTENYDLNFLINSNSPQKEFYLQLVNLLIIDYNYSNISVRKKGGGVLTDVVYNSVKPYVDHTYNAYNASKKVYEYVKPIISMKIKNGVDNLTNVVDNFWDMRLTLTDFDNFIKELIVCILNNYFNFAEDIINNNDFNQYVLFSNIDSNIDNAKFQYEKYYNKYIKNLINKLDELSNNFKGEYNDKIIEKQYNLDINKINKKTLITKNIETIKNEINNLKVNIKNLIEKNLLQFDFSTESSSNDDYETYKERMNIFIDKKLIISYEEIKKLILNLIDKYNNLFKNNKIENTMGVIQEKFMIEKYFELKQTNLPYKFFDKIDNGIFNNPKFFNVNGGETIVQSLTKQKNNIVDDIKNKYDEYIYVDRFCNIQSMTEIQKYHFKNIILSEINQDKSILSYDVKTKKLKKIADKFLKKYNIIVDVYNNYPFEWIFDIDYVMNNYLFVTKYLFNEQKLSKLNFDVNDFINRVKDILKTCIRLMYIEEIPEKILVLLYLLQNYESNLEIIFDFIINIVNNFTKIKYEMDDVELCNPTFVDEDEYLKLIQDLQYVKNIIDNNTLIDKKYNKYLMIVVKFFCCIYYCNYTDLINVKENDIYPTIEKKDDGLTNTSSIKLKNDNSKYELTSYKSEINTNNIININKDIIELLKIDNIILDENIKKIINIPFFELLKFNQDNIEILFEKFEKNKMLYYHKFDANSVIKPIEIGIIETLRPIKTYKKPKKIFLLQPTNVNFESSSLTLNNSEMFSEYMNYLIGDGINYLYLIDSDKKLFEIGSYFYGKLSNLLHIPEKIIDDNIINKFFSKFEDIYTYIKKKLSSNDYRFIDFSEKNKKIFNINKINKNNILNINISFNESKNNKILYVENRNFIEVEILNIFLVYLVTKLQILLKDNANPSSTIAYIAELIAKLYGIFNFLNNYFIVLLGGISNALDNTIDHSEMFSIEGSNSNNKNMNHYLNNILKISQEYKPKINELINEKPELTDLNYPLIKNISNIDLLLNFYNYFRGDNSNINLVIKDAVNSVLSDINNIYNSILLKILSELRQELFVQKSIQESSKYGESNPTSNSELIDEYSISSEDKEFKPTSNSY